MFAVRLMGISCMSSSEPRGMMMLGVWKCFAQARLFEVTRALLRGCGALCLAGAAILGELDCSGIGSPIVCDRVKSVDALRESKPKHNEVLLREIREDPNAGELLRVTQADAVLGRMTAPTPVVEVGSDEFLLNPRFGVERAKADGRVKVRAVDNMSWCADALDARCPKRRAKEGSVNGHTMPSEKLKHDTLDVFAQTLVMFVNMVGCVPGLIKVDHVLREGLLHPWSVPIGRPTSTALSEGSQFARTSVGRAASHSKLQQR